MERSNKLSLFVAMIALVGMASRAIAADWSNTEMQLQLGELDRPTFAGGGDEGTAVVTLQHASSWEYGDNFLFIDGLKSEKEDGFNDTDVYGEWFPNFSVGKISGHKISVGPLSDIGVLMGVNFGADANVLKFVPGVRISWDIPGFTFVNTDLMAYLDYNKGVRSGGAPQEDDAFNADVSWAYPFTYRGHSFSIEGHVEYLSARNTEIGVESSWEVLGQPQFRWNISKHIAVGIEWQFWINKLGDRATDENAVQALFVWKF